MRMMIQSWLINMINDVAMCTDIALSGVACLILNYSLIS